MKQYSKLVKGINNFLKVAIALFLALMSVTIIAQVIFRMLKMALPWSEELTRYLMEYVVFWGAAYAFSYKGHMIVNLLVDRYQGKVRKIWEIGVYLFLVFFFILVIKNSLSWIFTTRSQVSAAMQIPMWTVYMAIPTGSLFAILNCLEIIFREIRGEESV